METVLEQVQSLVAQLCPTGGAEREQGPSAVVVATNRLHSHPEPIELDDPWQALVRTVART